VEEAFRCDSGKRRGPRLRRMGVPGGPLCKASPAFRGDRLPFAIAACGKTPSLRASRSIFPTRVMKDRLSIILSVPESL